MPINLSPTRLSALGKRESTLYRRMVGAVGGRDVPGSDELINDLLGSYRVAASLMSTRSIGDFYLKDSTLCGSSSSVASFVPYLTAVPEVRVHVLKAEDRFMVVGTDGLWERVSNRTAAAVVASSFSDEELAATAGGPVAGSSSALDQFGFDARDFRCCGGARSSTGGGDAFTLGKSSGGGGGGGGGSERGEPNALPAPGAGSRGGRPLVDAARLIASTDAVLGDPAVRLVGLALTSVVEQRNARLPPGAAKLTLDSLLNLPTTSQTALASTHGRPTSRRFLHDDITCLVVALPSHLFDSSPTTIRDDCADIAIEGKREVLKYHASVNGVRDWFRASGAAAGAARGGLAVPASARAINLLATATAAFPGGSVGGDVAPNPPPFSPPVPNPDMRGLPNESGTPAPRRNTDLFAYNFTAAGKKAVAAVVKGGGAGR